MINLIYILIFFTSDHDSLCNSNDLKVGVPLFVKSVNWDENSSTLKLNFKPFSLGYNAGRSPEEAQVKISILNDYKFEDSSELGGMKRSLFINYQLVEICKDRVIVKFTNEVIKDTMKEKSEIYYFVSKQ